MNHDKFMRVLEQLETFNTENQESFNENTRISAFVYLYTARINRYFLEGTFSEGLSLVPQLEAEIAEYQLKIDQHRILLFYYKIACLYFGSGDNNKAIVYLNKIIHLRIGNLRADIQCFTRILHLIAHYELENYSLVEYLIKSVYHFIAKNKDLGQMMEEILKFLRKNIYANPKALRSAFADLKEKLVQLSQNPYERRSFLYLDIISWLESKIEGIPVQSVIHRKFVKKEKRI
jgi:tetratricopeptide (TPR) repeat protein